MALTGLREIDLEALHEPRQVRDDEDGLFFIPPYEREDLAVFGV